MKSIRPVITFLALALFALPAMAANREFALSAPAKVPSGGTVNAVISASTDAKGEQIGFLQAEYSLDGGETWTGISYDQDLGPRASRSAEIRSGAPGSTVMIRARIAFRGGSDGDVDYRGETLDWETSWNNWSTPPAKAVTVEVK